jgi:hypothetical protein
MSKPVRIALIRAGVANLKEYGYPSVTQENILTDMIFKMFFVSMLKDNLGKSAAHDEEINKLLEELK